MITKKMFLVPALLVGATVAQAGVVSIGSTISTVFEKDGLTKFEGGQLYLLVADTTGNGFGLNNDGTIGVDFELGVDDVVMKAWASPSVTAGRGLCKPNLTGYNEPVGLDAGDRYGVFFFDNIPLTDYTGAKTLAANTWYGFYSQSSMTIPVDGGSDAQVVSGLTLTPNQQVVPEPTTGLLALLGSGLLINRRRNRASVK